MTPPALIKIALLSALAVASAAGPAAAEGPVTPYGGYCKDCAVYGVCRENLPPRVAYQSLRKYYEERGYQLGRVEHKGRFLEAEVLQNNKLVDRVIFDRKTGRIRSIL